MTWKLQAITGELEGQEVTVDRDMLVGRHQDADLQLQAAEISRRHAAFLLKDNALWVQDLKSSNGTFVNDIRIDQDKLLMDGDIVQFASIKFSVLAPAQIDRVVAPPVIDEVKVVVTQIQQPAEAIAAAEIVRPVVETEPEVVEKSAAQRMNEQGMPELSARDANVQVSKDGMPTGMGVPKPAPIPANVDIHATPIPEACDIKTSDECVKEEVTTQKNAMLGLYTIIALVILAIIAWLFFK
ncbi:FHA domain-containing protein [Acinetobacter wuhouensis]|uniref:FHA domain-containing protein n=1 Tax=Acinetobacter wuhouensis TaxID=1879050 RepID=A0A3G2T6G8_9GAMM|nr:FHA domain-containing protein [Acinetobacter wuhouensis]AYO55913.1 FHA domain-containing protein [Acinetobacter wuhouensis]